MSTRPRLSRTAEQGAAALEKVGLTIAAAFLVGAVIFVLAEVRLPAVVSNAVCTVLGQEDCDAPAGQGKTPLELATGGRYVSMGDSYSSGEGAYDYHPDTDYDRGDDWDPRNWGDDERNRCHRSANAYSEVIQRDHDISFDGGFSFVACSGAEQSELTDPNPNNDFEDPQLEHLDEDVSLVTMSIGGNDLGFADVVTDCIINGERGVPMVDTCQEKHTDRIEERLDTLHDELVETYAEIKERSPNARIIIVGYPQLFPPDPQDNYDNLLFAEDQRWMNEQAQALNNMLREAAREAGVEFIDPSDAFRDHGIGSDDPWINDLTFGGPGISLVDPGSFHPNAQGHAAIAELLDAQIRDPEYP